jgi:hypothetical protein
MSARRGTVPPPSRERGPAHHAVKEFGIHKPASKIGHGAARRPDIRASIGAEERTIGIGYPVKQEMICNRTYEPRTDAPKRPQTRSFRLNPHRRVDEHRSGNVGPERDPHRHVDRRHQDTRTASHTVRHSGSGTEWAVSHQGPERLRRRRWTPRGIRAEGRRKRGPSR